MASQYPAYGMRAPPQAWPPPFQGAAPPMPAGMNVNQQQWKMGFWQFNPAFKPNPQQPQAQHVPWVPGQAWPQTRQQPQANYNPYKKVPKPPSAEYLSEPLVDNPLGLTNMIPAENRYGDDNFPEPPPETPWIWNPAVLSTDDDSTPSQDIPNKSSGGSRSGPSSSAPHNHRFDPSQARQSSEPSSSSSSRQNGHEPRARHYATDPTSNGRNGHTASGGSVPGSHNDRDTVPRFDRPKNPEYYRRLGYTDDYQPPASGSAAVPQNNSASNSAPVVNSVPKEMEDFTSKRELKPTFSTNIVRTPQHYRTQSQSGRSSSTPTSRENSHSSMESLNSHMERMTTANSSSTSLSRHPSSSSTSLTSDHSKSMTGVSTYVDEPASMLSPLMIAATPKPSARPIERYHTYPDIAGRAGLSTIAETFTAPQDVPRPPRQRHTPPETYSSSPLRRSSSSREPTPPRTPSKLTPPRDNSKHIAPLPSGIGSGSHSTLYLPPNPLIANPLPPPPREVRYLPISPPPRQGPPRADRKLVRKGFWNRRGDHLTSSGYIVYAPEELANPDELKEYPEVGDAYKDNFGTIIEYNPDRPELPESLPRYGKPPEQPYRDFLKYDYAL